MSKIGRNIILYQKIEFSLKAMLPFIHPEAKGGLEEFRKLKFEVSGKTLGQLFGEFNSSYTARSLDGGQDTASALEGYFKQIVSDRNALVHTLLNMDGMTLETSEGCKKIIKYLDERLSDIQSLNEFLEPIRRQIGSLIKEIEYDEEGKVKSAFHDILEIGIKFE